MAYRTFGYSSSSGLTASLSWSGGGAGTGTIQGTSGNDTLTGTSGNDTISGLGGNDVIAGGAGADTISGDSGSDTLFSGAASPDWTFPYYGLPYTPPVLDRGIEVDTVNGGDGDDAVFVGYGDNANGGNQSVSGDKLFISFQGATTGIVFDFHLDTQVIGGGTITGFESVSWVEGSNYDDHIDLGQSVFSSYSPYSDRAAVFGMGGNDTLIAGYYTQLLDGGDGSDVLDGRDSLYLGELDGGEGDDVIYGPGSPNAVANGQGGNDTIYAGCNSHGGAGDDVIALSYSGYIIHASGDDGNDQITGDLGIEFLEGNDGNDILNAGAGDDFIDGGSGQDLITGGVGNDTLTGGTGNDQFDFSQGDGKDTITDFAAGDILSIDGYDAAQSVSQVGADVVVTFSPSDQVTFQNSDVATVQAGLQFAAPTDDTLIGTDNNDYLQGFGGDDSIEGRGGLDVISGGHGSDVLDGGDGADTIYTDDVSPEFEFPWNGQPYTVPLMDRGAEIDTVQGGAGDDVIFAGYGDNVDGGTEDYQGDKLFISFQGATSGVTFDFREATQVIGGGTITGIENLSWVEGSNFDDYINASGGSGNGYSDSTTVFGMGGNDTLLAGYYTTFLDGGDGNDIVDGRGSQYLQDVNGGAGDDTLYTSEFYPANASGYSGNDLIYANGYADGGSGNDTIFLISSASGGSWAWGETGDDSITGTGKDDYISGNTDDDTLSGGGGDDHFLFTAGDGQDVITDFSSGDTLELTGYTQAQSIVQDGADVIVTFSNTDQVRFLSSDVATVQAGLVFPSTDDRIIGTSSNDTLYGYGGNDVLTGAGGADALYGGDGDDTLFSGGNGLEVPDLDTGLEHDLLSGGGGSDHLFIGYGDDADGGADTDWLHASFAEAPTGVMLDSSQLGTGVTIGGGTIQNIERVDSLTGSAFADTFILTNQSYASVFGQAGDDTISVIGDVALVEGGDGNDEISVTGLNADIDGGAGDDTITVNGSNAYVQAGSGNDIVESLGGSFLLNGGDGVNTLSYSHSTTGVVVNLATNQGAGGESLDGFQNVTGSDFADTLTGRTDDNVLHGAGGNDTLNGDAGNDTLDGGAGNDTMAGGAGDDIYYVDSASDSVTEASAAGNDTVHADVTYTLGSNVENGILEGTSAINLTGNTLANMLTGNSAANILDGGAGDDMLTGSGGVDTFVYRTGGGRDVITDFTAGEAINIYGYTAAQSVVQSGVNVVVTLASGNTITVNNSTVANVSAALHFQTSGGGGGTPGTITGTSGADTLNGTSAADTINGLGGNDTLNGSGGNDILDGGTGNDTMRGGTGNDIFYVDSTSDVVTELSGQGSDEVRSTVSYTLGSNLERATALGSGAINLTGNTLANTLTGNSGANIIKGNGGADTIKGGLGNDTLSGGSGVDVFVYSDVNSGADKITDFVSGSDKINLHAFGITSANVHTAVSGSNLVISVDADHNGTNDFTITLVGVTHIAASDYVF